MQLVSEGVIEAVSKMAFGNKLGVSLRRSDENDLFFLTTEA